MSLLATAKAGVETAFKVGAEFVRVGSYRKRTGNPTYDPVTDSLGEDGNVITNIRFMRTASTIEEREGSPVSISDDKFIVPAIDLPNIRPGENDIITLDGVDYNVLISKFVPGDVIHIIFARRA